jgi:IPT/TIG domain/S-layer homology domain
MRTLLPLLAGTVWCLLIPALAQPQPPAIANIILNPIVVNVFWDANWDVHNPGMTEAQIDNFTWALFQSSYFSSLMSAYGVQSVTFAGGLQADSSCAPIGTVSPTAPNNIDILSAVPTDFTVNGFIWCEAGLISMPPPGTNVIYNIFFPPQTAVKTLGVPLCSSASGLHFHGVSQVLVTGVLLGGVIAGSVAELAVLNGSRGPIFTEIPTATECLAATSPGGLMGFSSLTETLTHEIVEAITDPYPSLGAIVNENEIVDICNSATTPFLASFDIGPASPSGGQASNYFSTVAGVCVSGNTGPGPVITSIAFNVPPAGSSPMSSLQILVTGSGFGTLPLPLSDFVSNTIVGPNGPGTLVTALPAVTNVQYFSLTDNLGTASMWEAGNSINQDLVQLNFASWTDAQILINGFGPSFGINGTAINIGDQLTIIACNPTSGFCFRSAPATVPAPVTLKSISPNTGPASGGTTVTIAGSGFESGTTVLFAGQPFQGNVAFVSATELTLMTPPGFPGSVQVRVQNPDMINPSSGTLLYNYCAPSVSSVTPDSGLTNGGTRVTIAGACLSGASYVYFGGGNPLQSSEFSIDNAGSIHAQTPSSCPGVVDVRVDSPDANSFTESPISAGDKFQYKAPSKIPVCREGPQLVYIPGLCAISLQACQPVFSQGVNESTLPPTTTVNPFTDLSGYGGLTVAINTVARQGIMRGVSNESFNPSGAVTRGEFAIYLERMLRLPESPHRVAFSDLASDNVASRAVEALLPYLDYYMDSRGTFAYKPDQPLDGRTAAAVAANLLLASGSRALLTLRQADTVAGHVRDWRKVDATTRRQIATAIAAGAIITPARRFDPGRALNRAQTAVLLVNLERLTEGRSFSATGELRKLSTRK